MKYEVLFVNYHNTHLEDSIDDGMGPEPDGQREYKDVEVYLREKDTSNIYNLHILITQEDYDDPVVESLKMEKINNFKNPEVDINLNNLDSLKFITDFISVNIPKKDIRAGKPVR